MKKLLISTVLTIALAGCGAHTRGEHTGHTMSEGAMKTPAVVNAGALPESGDAKTLSFRIMRKGEVFTDFGVSHTKEMHLIIIRTDLTQFEHVHPARKADGTWELPHRFREPGEYWLFADFVEKDGTPHVMRFSRVVGTEKFPAIAWTGENLLTSRGFKGSLGDLSVTITPAVTANDATLTYALTDKTGATVPAETYLGASGHSVLIGEDGSYMHLHPDHESATPTFNLKLPAKGKYRLFTEIKAKGTVYLITSDVGV